MGSDVSHDTTASVNSASSQRRFLNPVSIELKLDIPVVNPKRTIKPSGPVMLPAIINSSKEQFFS